jgi:putrescine transport system ATP-binding protein
MVKLDSGRQVRVTRANSSRKDDERFEWEDPVFLSWDPGSPVVGNG